MSVADDFFAAIGACDVEAARAVYAPGAVIWHNTDGIEQDVPANLAVLGWMAANFSDRSYCEVRRHEWDTGFVQQHVLRMTKRDGTRVELRACVVATVADGKVTRIDEYLNPAEVARIAG
jgi:ketosteroid isomerase-like protein